MYLDSLKLTIRMVQLECLELQSFVPIYTQTTQKTNENKVTL